MDRIAEVLWGDRQPQRPAENVATLVSRLRAALGPGVVEGDRDGYRLGDPPSVECGSGPGRRAARGGATAGGQRTGARARRRAARAWPARYRRRAGRGRVRAQWAEPTRTEIEVLLRHARHAGARAALALDEPATARTLAGAATDAEPYDEEAHRLLMRAEMALGEPARALACYQRAVRTAGQRVRGGPGDRDPRHPRGHPARAGPQPAAVRPEPLGPRPAPRSGLAGRDSELARLDAAWAAAAGGTPALLLITGEPGIGKTRLAGEVAELAARTGGTVLSARCYDTERSLFLQPIVEAVGQHVARSSPATFREDAGDWAVPLAALVPEIAVMFDGVPEPHGAVELQRRRVYDAIAQYVYRLATSPVLLLLDDLQNAGLATVELLHYLIRQAGLARLLVVATVRAEEGVPAIRALAPVAERIELGPLTEAAVTQLAREAGHAELAAPILARTGGHTLFVVETLRALASGASGTEIPVSLQEAVLARVGRTGQATRELLHAAAVLGATIDPGTLARMLDVAPAQATQRCEQALAARLLVVADRAYEFANDLIREVLYQNMPMPTRLAYHRRAAELLGAHPEAVAAHADAAGDWRWAARAWLLAGEEASQRFAAAADAEALFTHALEAAERIGDLEVTGRARLARGRVRDVAGPTPTRSRTSARGERGAAGRRPAAGDAGTARVVRGRTGGAGPVHRRVRGQAAQRVAPRRVARGPGDRGRSARPDGGHRQQPAAAHRSVGARAPPRSGRPLRQGRTRSRTGIGRAQDGVRLPGRGRPADRDPGGAGTVATPAR